MREKRIDRAIKLFGNDMKLMNGIFGRTVRGLDLTDKPERAVEYLGEGALRHLRLNSPLLDTLYHIQVDVRFHQKMPKIL